MTARPLLAAFLLFAGCAPSAVPDHVLSRATYREGLQGFWLGESLANWTGLVTEMDRIGGDGLDGRGAGFYTRDDWGTPDRPNIWGGLSQGTVSDTIDFVLVGPDGVWGADDDTDIEYLYLDLTWRSPDPLLTAEQIRDGWLAHVYSDGNTPFRGPDGQPENFLWVSNQAAHDLMREGVLPPETSDPARNPHAEMIDAQLTTEIFGLFAPGRPDLALELAYLPIRTTARGPAARIAEFYVVMHALAPVADPSLPMAERLRGMADEARRRLPDGSYPAAMYDFVAGLHGAGIPWEAARDSLHERYQVRGEDGYDWAVRDPVCHGCFAAGINFAASLVSLFWGEGDLRETIRIGALAGWDSDNPTATWGGLLGFMLGREGVERAFGGPLSDRFDIHRTRGGFERGIDTFGAMADRGVAVVDRVVTQMADGRIDAERDAWVIPRDRGTGG